MPRTSPFFKFVSLLDRFQDCIKFEYLVFEPHFYVNERVCEGLRQVIKVLLQFLVLCILEQELLLRQLVLFRQVFLAAQIDIHFRTVGQHGVQLVLVEKLVETIRSRVVLLVLSMHDVDVVDELGQKVVHALGSSCEFHDLIERAICFRFRDLTVNLEILLEALQGC